MEVSMEVYIVRHGEVPHNAFEIYNGEDEDLTDKGIIDVYKRQIIYFNQLLILLVSFKLKL